MIEGTLTLYFPIIILIAINSGLLGSFVLWKKFSNMSESISHFSVLGAAISFIFSYHLNLMIFSASLVYVALIYIMRKKFPSDILVALFANIGLALALVLSTFFSKIRIDFMSLLFGDILITNYNDLLVMLVMTIAIACITTIFWKEIVLTILSTDLAKAKSINTSMIDLFILIAVVTYITVAVKIIGAILLSSMLIIPAASASLIANSPKKMVFYSIAISLLSQTCGMVVSLKYDIATSAAVALCGFIIFCLVSFYSTIKN